MSFTIPYSWPKGSLHVIPDLLLMPEELYEVIIVSQRTLSLINDFARLDVRTGTRWATSLGDLDYLTPEPGDAEYGQMVDLVNAFRLEVVPMTQPIADALNAIAAALAGMQPDDVDVSCGGCCDTSSVGNALGGVPTADILPEAPLEVPDQEGDPPQGFENWGAYLDYKCQAAFAIWKVIDAMAGNLQTMGGVVISTQAATLGVSGALAAGGIVFPPLAVVAIVTQVVLMGTISALALFEISQFKAYWLAHKTELVCSLYSSGTAAQALEAIAGVIEDAVQAITWEGVLAPFSAELGAAVGAVFSQLESNNLVNPLFHLVGTIAGLGESCSCGQRAWHYDLGDEDWTNVDVSTNDNTAPGVWSESAPIDAGDASPGHLQVNYNRTSSSGLCRSQWSWSYPLGKPVAALGDIFDADCYCSNSTGTNYSLSIIYEDDSADTAYFQNPSNWATRTVAVTGPNVGKNIKSFMLQADGGSAGMGTRIFAFDKAEFIPLS